MAPGTLDTHLTAFLRKVCGEAKPQVVALLGAVHARCDLSVGTVDKALSLGLARVHGEDTVIVAAEVVYGRWKLCCIGVLEVRQAQLGLFG